jgi:GNAT superfamily N-acetyltransferase
MANGGRAAPDCQTPLQLQLADPAIESDRGFRNKQAIPFRVRRDPTENLDEGERKWSGQGISLFTMLRVEPVTEATTEVHTALARLLPQLNAKLTLPPFERLEAIVADPSVTLLVARERDEIVGTATVIVYTTPFWIKARLDEVVVDESARGQGVGAALVSACVDIARAKGAQVAELQSGVLREAANRLYKRMGFELRESNLYRMVLRA